MLFHPSIWPKFGQTFGTPSVSLLKSSASADNLTFGLSLVDGWFRCPTKWRRQHDHRMLLAYKTVLYSKADHPRMRAFSCAWSLPITWQKLRSHHSIRHSKNPMLHANFMAPRFIETELLPMKVLHCRNRDFRPFCPCDRDPMTFIIYTTFARIAWRYTGCANTNFLSQGFRKL